MHCVKCFDLSSRAWDAVDEFEDKEKTINVHFLKKDHYSIYHSLEGAMCGYEKPIITLFHLEEFFCGGMQKID